MIMKRTLLAVLFSAILLLGSIGLNSANASVITSLSLNTNVEKGIPPTQGDTVVFTGQLIQADTSRGIPNATINIIHKVSFGNNRLLATGQTGADGSYSLPWVIDVQRLGASTEQRSESGSQGAKINRMQVVVVASYDGNDKYSGTVSGEQSFEIRLNKLNIKTEKETMYLANDKVTVRVIITDIDNNLVDPDTITSNFDNNPVTLQKESTGSYLFSVVSLSTGRHQLEVRVAKLGYISEQTFLTIEAMKRKTAIAISADKATYQLGETVTIMASLIDRNTNQVVTDRAVSGALTTPALTLHQLTFVNGKASFMLNRTAVAGTWTVSASFGGDDSYFSSASQASFTVSREVVAVTPPPAKEKVSLSVPTFVDQSGNTLKEVSAGQQVMIQANVASNLDTTQDVVYITQVKDSDGITVALSWINVTLEPGQKFEPAVSWSPDASGTYTVEVFMWKSIKNPQPLSSNKMLTITVS